MRNQRPYGPISDSKKNTPALPPFYGDRSDHRLLPNPARRPPRRPRPAPPQPCLAAASLPLLRPSSARALLSLPLSTSSALSSFKFFFSSLSPILSSSRIPNSPSTSPSTPPPPPPLPRRLPRLPLQRPRGSGADLRCAAAAAAKGGNVAASMRQLLHDYAWDLVADEEGSGTASRGDFGVRSNLVVMLSPACRDRKSGCEFLGVEVGGEGMSSADWLCDKFHGFFKNVNDAFVSKDIHFSWVDVNCESECEVEEVGDEDSEWEGFWASVLLKNGRGDSRIGILKPFTISSALLFLPKIASSPNMEAVNPLPFAGKHDSNVLRSSPDMLDTIGSNDFHAFEGLEMKLEDLYFSRETGKSKKLKFLKCWMKQAQRAIQPGLKSDGSEPQVHMPIEMENRQADTPEVNEQPISACASCGEDSLTAVSRVQDEVACGNDIVSPEDFLSSIPSKTRQGIESEGVDLGALAERLVKSCTLYIYQNFESELAAVNQSPSANADDASCSRVAAELMKLVLLDPKDLSERNKTRDQSCPKSDSTASARVIREYELQIFFRMEILRLQIATIFKESVKLKFVKQICLFLECIQCQMEGGFFGDWSLHNYVGKIIKSRYFTDLEEVVQRIYSKMDLLLFHDEEDELPNLQLNSQDSSKCTDEDKMDKNIQSDRSVSAENELDERWQGDNARANREEHLRRLNEAQERRERARRFASFTSWVPDLQRVWAPKQPGGTKNQSDPRRKLLKKKDRTRTTCDMVFETPMTDNKRSCLRANSGKNKQDPSSKHGSVSRLYFLTDN
ncbi:uncharacterized protein LOC120289577 [Eucalyptus grandis]|uniref:uncharacterized protein LOC120289577 n=1 Tax=Eucalyptus grandis TaxID=71139 RepID=UPI00192EAF4E|nr:uncharacterized protein LOC120289577 [Eucalyptus grandis]